MGLWRVPEKVLLPAEPGLSPSAFEFNGRLASGEQVMAYAQARYHQVGAMDRPILRGHTAALFRFNADGVLTAVDFTSAGHDPQDPDRSYRQSRALLAELAQRVKAEGWVSADILVSPFYVVVDGLATGLVYHTTREDEGEDSDYSPEEVRLVPFDKILRRPWITGTYDT